MSLYLDFGAYVKLCLQHIINMTMQKSNGQEKQENSRLTVMNWKTCKKYYLCFKYFKGKWSFEIFDLKAGMIPKYWEPL